MIVHDISIPLAPATPEWPGDTPCSCGWSWSIAAGASVNVSTITTSPHVGTHADAPLHVRDGAPPSDQLPIAAFVGRARVIDVSDCTGEIGEAALAKRGYHRGDARLILKTGATIATGVFPARWPALAPDAARALAAAGVQLVAVDCPSVDDRDSKSLAVHHALFDGGAFVLENLDLRAVAAGEYQLSAAPLLITGLDAAPARALLRPLDGQ